MKNDGAKTELVVHYFTDIGWDPRTRYLNKDFEFRKNPLILPKGVYALGDLGYFVETDYSSFNFDFEKVESFNFDFF